MARPRKVVDKDLLIRLAKIHCTDAEIASVLGISTDTLARRFRKVIDEARLTGKASLRRKQWEVASAGNPTMLIWLGKQQLAQRDRPDESTASSEAEINTFLAAVKRTPAERAALFESLPDKPPTLEDAKPEPEDAE